MSLRALIVPLLIAATAHAEAPAAPSVAAAVPHRAVALPSPSDVLWSEGRGGPVGDRPVTMQSFSRLARLVGPAVVFIIVTQRSDEETPGPHGGHGGGEGKGTGFVIHPSGLIVTNQHVVRNAELIKVRLADEHSYVARVVGTDERSDLALLAIEPDAPLPVIKLGDSDKVEIGEWVMAIGNPFGLDHTFTVGIISAKGRRDVKPGGQTYAADFIQTDASINAGNSGGPLINTRGEVVAINTAINAVGQGIAFSVPINVAKALLPSLYQHGRVDRAWLGVFWQALTPTLARSFGLREARGALVTDVVRQSPAAAAGIEPGDVVLEFDGHAIGHGDELAWWVSRAASGKTVPVLLVRHGERRRVEAALVALPEEPRAPEARPPSEKPHVSALGISVSEISEGDARELGHPSLHGLVVTLVEAASPAADAGVERGDILVRVGDLSLQGIDDYARAVRAVGKGDLIRLLVKRGGKSNWVAFPKR